MKKIVIVLYVSVSVFCFGEDLYLAPILYIKAGEESLEQDKYMQEIIVSQLNKMKDFFGYEIVKTGDEIARIRSSNDAGRFCESSGSKYVIYGWIKEDDYSIEGEIRLYSFEDKKSVMVVYNKDGEGQSVRFMEDLCKKILDGLHELFLIPKPDETKSFSMINMNVGIGYWSFITPSWVKHLLGTVIFQTGFEIIPSDIAFLIRETPVFFSFGMNLEYLFGLNSKSSVPSYLNTIRVQVYAGMHFRFYDRHSFGIILGQIKNIGILWYKEKYSSPNVAVSSDIGISLGFAYKYNITDKIKVCIENESELVFCKPIFFRNTLRLSFEFALLYKESL